MQTIGGTFLALLMLFAGTQIFVSGQASEKGDTPEPSERSGQRIVGAWRTAVTPRNCQTGLPVAPAFRGLFTFHQGGTMSEFSVGPGSTPALRSPGHGVWERGQGLSDYSLSFILNRYDASGVFIGTEKVTATLELGSKGQ